jgi:hypothetical protein
MKKPELDLEELYHRLAGYHFNIFARLQVFTEESAEMRAERTGKSFKECYDEIGDLWGDKADINLQEGFKKICVCF